MLVWYLKSGPSLTGREQVFGCKIRPGIENLLKNNTQITILFFGLFGFSQIHKNYGDEKMYFFLKSDEIEVGFMSDTAKFLLSP